MLSRVELSPDAAPDSIYFSPEHNILRSQLRRFVDREIKPHAQKWEDAGFVPRELLQRMGSLGFLGIRWPECFGGSGLDTLASIVLAEELGKSTFGGVAITVLVHTDMASPHLLRAGTPEQLERWASKIVSGNVICAIAITEPTGGSDVAGIRTTARRVGDNYVINGSKIYITNAVHADLFFVAAKTGAAATGAHAISLFLVEKGTPGFSVGPPLKKHGWLSSDTAELRFLECSVPAQHLLGAENKGFYAIVDAFQNERTVLAAQAIGEASAALALTLDWTRQRTVFGAPLWGKQSVRQNLAMLSAKVEAGRQLVYHAAWLNTQGADCVKAVSMAKAFCGDIVNEVMQACLQLHGGFGYMAGTPIERMIRDARVHSIGGGASEVMQEEVAKRL